MQTKTALAVAGSVLAVPSTALAAAQHTDSDTPGREALRASGRLTRDAAIQERLVRTNLRLARREARLSGDKLRKGYARRVKDDPVERHPHAQPAPAQAHHPPRPRRRLDRLGAAAGDRRLRVGRRPVDEHRQRVLRQVPVHAVDLAERRRHRQPRRGLRGRAGSPRRDALRAGREHALARLRAVAAR